MKTIDSNSGSGLSGQPVQKLVVDEDKKHPFLEKKLEDANKLIKQVGLPKAGRK